MHDKKFPAINREKCLTCRACVGICPSGAIRQLRREPEIDASLCTRCGLCVQTCPAKAIYLSASKAASEKIAPARVGTPAHLDKPYDIIIIGGGIAGLSTALGAVYQKPGLKILVLEKKRKIGEDINSSAGTWCFSLEPLLLTPEEMAEIVLQKFTKIGLSDENESAVIEFPAAMSETIDLSRLLQILSDKLIKEGIQIETNSFVDNVEQTKKGFMIDVIANGVAYPLKSRILVDASGVDSFASRKLGLQKSWSQAIMGAGAEYEMTWDGDPNIVWLVCSMKNKRLGYAWSFPIGNNLSRVGLSVRIETFKGNTASIQEELDSFISSHFLVKQNVRQKISRINFKCGAYPFKGMAEKIISERFLRVGDAASQANPFLGEGIYYAIKYGMKAGSTMAKANTGDVSELRPYENYVFKDRKKFEEDNRVKRMDYGRVIKRINEIKDTLSDEERRAFLSFIMPLESQWTAKIRVAAKILGYKETMKHFGRAVKKKIRAVF